MWTKTLRTLRTRLDRRRRSIPGTCNACGRRTRFLPAAGEGHQRESMHCLHCRTASRKRHLIQVLLDLFAPGVPSLAAADLRHLSIYSAVAGDTLQRFLGPGHPAFVCSELFPDLPEGQMRAGVYCQNLERLTFVDEAFDVVITEDVLEHVCRPALALREIRRVLKPGGYHVFTVPFHADRRTLRLVDDEGRALLPPAWHYDAAGRQVPVITEWGYDLFDVLAAAGFETRMSLSSWRDARERGIADSIVFFSRRLP